MWPTAQPLSTDRLLLEPLAVEHAIEMVDVLADPAIYAYTGGEPPEEAQLRERYERQVGHDGWLNWVLRLRTSGEAIGTVQATIKESGVAELAWVVASRAQGYGYAGEAAAAMIAWLHSVGIDEFEAHIHPKHEASMAVARRLGFERTDTVRQGEPRWELRTRCHN